MSKAPEKVAFAMEVNSKLNGLIEWIIENTPNKEHTLHKDDFVDVQEEFRKIACGLDAQTLEPEPSEGGAQYVSVTPAPWP
ncbi:MAG: hypothetical protein Q7T48_13160 [Cellvibrio sp.]|uniref:hypothetical protein n=1 Tax=Cellvibrio sp. TaxID=1965322 RepID=UPI0027156527|nr:hypothetical protein [Cellvibrio sp.]